MTWQIDPSHTNIGFEGRHMLVSKVRGKFSDFEADLAIDPENLEQSKATFRIKAESLDSGFGQRDEHLKSADFFDVEKYPEIVFDSRKIARNGGDGSYIIEGDLTIRDVTRPVRFKAEVGGPVKNPWGGEVIALDAETEINRKDWDLNWNMALEAGGVLVSDKIKLQLATELNKVEAQN